MIDRSVTEGTASGRRRASLLLGAAAMLIASGLAIPASSQAVPANDDRVDAETVALINGSSSVTRNNQESFLEAGEDLTCGSSDIDSSVWFRFVAPGTGTATFRAGNIFEYFGDTFAGEQVGNEDDEMDTVLGVYPAGSSARIGCNDDDPSGDNFSSRLAVSVQGGAAYDVQIAGYDTPDAACGVICFADEGVFSYSVDFTAAPVIQPGRVSVVPKDSFLRFGGGNTKKKKRFKSKVTNFTLSTEGGAQVVIRCLKCGFGTRTFTAGPNGTVNAKGLFKRLLRPRTVIEVFVTVAGREGSYLRWKIRKGKTPVERDCPINVAGAVQC